MPIWEVVIWFTPWQVAALKSRCIEKLPAWEVSSYYLLVAHHYHLNSILFSDWMIYWMINWLFICFSVIFFSWTARIVWGFFGGVWWSLLWVNPRGGWWLFINWVVPSRWLSHLVILSVTVDDALAYLDIYPCYFFLFLRTFILVLISPTTSNSKTHKNSKTYKNPKTAEFITKNPQNSSKKIRKSKIFYIKINFMEFITQYSSSSLIFIWFFQKMIIF